MISQWMHIEYWVKLSFGGKSSTRRSMYICILCKKRMLQCTSLARLLVTQKSVAKISNNTVLEFLICQIS